MFLDNNTLIALGLIVKPRGLTGEVLVIPHKPSSRSFRPGLNITISLNNEETSYYIEKSHPAGKYMGLKLRGINDREAAGKLVGGQVFCVLAQLAAKNKDEYYIFELIGLKLIDKHGVNLGVVKDFISLPANDLLVVESGGSEFFLPLIKEIVREINLNDGFVKIDSIDRIKPDED